ncbi:MAG: trimethylamine methyltransferase family protein [Pseudomonadota bacterium]
MSVEETTEDSGGRRGGGRRGRGSSGGASARRQARSVPQLVALPNVTRNLEPTDILSLEAIEIIENNADILMEEVGVTYSDDEEALAMWKEAGADVKGDRVHFPKGLCRELMKTAPSTFTQHARNPERNVEIGGKNTVFAPVYGPPFVRDLDGERRYATIEDFRTFVKLAYMAPAMHHSGGTVCEPCDIPVNKRHLDMVYSHIKYSDKPFMGSVTAPERAEDTVKMAQILFGEEFVDQNCVLVSLVNCNSPLTLDGTMLGALKTYARANQASVVSPFIVGGAMSPTTVAGTLTQVLCEATSGVAFSQLCRPGSPVIMGTFATSMSMQSGAPAFGTPEPAQVLMGAAQFARRYGLPFRSGGSLTGAKIPDAQAAYDSANTLWPAMMGGVNFMLHAAGWLEGGLVSSFEKFVMDCDQLAAAQKFANGIDISENGLALDAIREVGPGSHFLDCAHTHANYKTALYTSNVADNNSFEQWEVEGQQRIEQRANKTARAWLDAYQAPALDIAKDEELLAFITAKKESMPDAFT